MNFGESGSDVGSNEVAREGQRFFGRPILPTVGTEVVATQDDAIFGQPMPSRQVQYESPKIPRLHPGVATELIHLIRRGLHQEVAIIFERLQNRSLDYKRVRRADRVDANGFPTLMPCHSLEQ